MVIALCNSEYFSRQTPVIKVRDLPFKDAMPETFTLLLEIWSSSKFTSPAIHSPFQILGFHERKEINSPMPGSYSKSKQNIEPDAVHETD